MVKGRIQKLLTKRLSDRYTLVLVLVAALAIVSQVLTQLQLQNQERDSEYFNQIRHQRNTSKEISKLCLKLELTPQVTERGKIVQQIQANISKLIEKHKNVETSVGLIKNIDLNLIQDAHVHLRDMSQSISVLANNLSGDGLLSNESNRKEIERIFIAESNYREVLDQWLLQYEAEISESIRSMRWFELVILFLLLLLLFISYVYIFKPTMARLNQTLGRLEESELRKKAILDSSLDAIITIDSHGKIVEFNTNAENMFERFEKDVLGLSLDSLLFTEDSRYLLKQALDEFKNDQVNHVLNQRFEVEGKTKSGQTFPMEMYVTVIETEPHHFFTVFCRDIRIRKEEEIELLRAKQTAEQALQTRSDFMSRVSHEIRHPLHAILGMADLILDTSLTQQQIRFVEVLKRASLTLLNLINDILDFSKIESGKLNVEHIEFNLYELVERAVDLVAPQAYQNGLEVIIEYDPKVHTHLVTDPTRLQQILTNLLSNAVKFTEKGSVTIKIYHEEGSSFLNIEVRDTGVGIPKHKIENIFESFVQADESVTRKYGGTGLGLSISKKLVEILNGRISVESAEEKGSTFKVEIPYIKPTVGESLEIELSKRVLNKTVWIMGKDPYAKLWKQWLSFTGCEVKVFLSAQDVQAYLKSNPKNFDLLISDTIGPEIISKKDWLDIKELNAGGDVVLTVVPGDFEQVPRELRMTASVHFVFKPVRPLNLIETLQEIVTHKREGPFDISKSGVSGPRFPEGLRVLAVDDAQENLEIIGYYLSDKKVSLSLAYNGREAVDLFRAKQFDLILMDVRMPLMDGYTAAYYIREIERKESRARAPIVILTAHGDISEKEKARQAECDLVLNKPLSKEILSRGILEVLGEVGDSSTSIQDSKTTREDGIEKELIKNLRPTYLKNRLNDLEILKEAAIRDDFQTISNMGHKIKGNAKSYGFEDLGVIANGLEVAAKSKNSNEIRTLMLKMESFIQEALHEL